MGYLILGFFGTMMAGDQVLSGIELPAVHGSDNTARRKLNLFESSAAVPDAVFLGVSYTLFGVSPSVVDPAAGARLGRSVRSLNLAAEGHTLLAEALLVRCMIDRGRLPSVVYFGVSPGAADSREREAMIRSLRSLADARDLKRSFSSSWEFFAETVWASLFGAYHQFHDMRLLTQRLLIGAPLHDQAETLCDEYGWLRWNGGDKRSLLNPSVNPIDRKDARARQCHDPKNINGRALREAIVALERQGVSVRLLELPVSTTAPLSKKRMGHDSYLKFLQEVSKGTSAKLVRPPPTLVGDEDFFDHGHLNTQGAQKLSRWLAGDLAEALRRKWGKSKTSLTSVVINDQPD